MDTNIIAFTRGVPPAESFPIKSLIACAEQVILQDGEQILQYGTGAGYHPMREYIADRYGVNTDRVLVGQGSLQLLDHLCRVMLHEGDTVFVEQPTYDRTITLFKRAGAKLSGMEILKNGIDLDALQSSLADGCVPRFVYVIPDFQNPSGAAMPLEARKKLAALSGRYGFMIIEDGPYRHLRYTGEQLPTLFELAPANVIFMSSFSKMISPGLRTGFMILPEGIAADVIKFASDTYISPSMFDQALVHAFFNKQPMEEHIQFLKTIFQPRMKTLLGALDAEMSEFGRWIQPEGGYYVGFFLDERFAGIDREKAAAYGLALTDGRGFFINGGANFLRLPFCALTEDEIREGISRLRKLILG